MSATDQEDNAVPRVVVAVLDGPVDLDHPCFGGIDVTKDESVGLSGGTVATLHGTQIASIIAQLAAHASIVSIPIFSSNQEGRILPTSQIDLARALDRALNLGAHVINISGGQLIASAHVDPRLESALKSCADRDVLIVSAAGNDACDCIHVPAAVPSVLAVGAMDEFGNPLDMSNWGAAYRDHGVVALGKDIPVALPGGRMGQGTGTSYAAAVVSGKAAVLMGELVQRGERPSGKRVRDAIVASAIDCAQQETPDCHRLLAGRFNPAGALALLQQTAPDGAEAEHRLPASDSFLHPSVPLSPEGVTRSMSNEIAAKEPEGLRPSACACGGGGGGCACANSETAAVPPKASAGKSHALTYALGRIGIDFRNEANRDSFLQRGLQNPEDPAQLLKHLEQEPWATEAITWTLVQDSIPIYAVQPAGAFVTHVYEQLASLLDAQRQGKAEIVALAGYSGGSATLSNGKTVPFLAATPRGIVSWKNAELVQTVTEKHGPDTAVGLSNFIERVFHELRNLGLRPEERALNFVATQAMNHAGIFADAISRKMTLDSSEVKKSPTDRPGSDCWDVKLSFFNPAERLTQARHVYRITVDVSEALPVRVGDIRHWDVF